MPMCIYGSHAVEVTFTDKEAKIRANPCLSQPPISVRVQLEGTRLWSHSSHYNDYNVEPKIEDLYSGLLQKQVDKTCLNKDGQLSNLDIPVEIKNCVPHCHTTRRYERRTSTQFSFTIIDPRNKNRKKVVKTELKIDEHCTPENIEVKRGNENDEDPGVKAESVTKEETKLPSPPENTTSANQTVDEKLSSEAFIENLYHGTKVTKRMTIGIIVGASILVLILIITVTSLCIVCSKKKKQKPESEHGADVNPMYEGGADYEYDDMGNYNDNDDNNDEVSPRKKEVRAEVVDTSSIYGEREEGWEDAVIVDTNPDYGE